MKALQVQLKTIELSDNVLPNDENTQSVSGHFKASRIVLKCSLSISNILLKGLLA